MDSKTAISLYEQLLDDPEELFIEGQMLLLGEILPFSEDDTIEVLEHVFDDVLRNMQALEKAGMPSAESFGAMIATTMQFGMVLQREISKENSEQPEVGQGEPRVEADAERGQEEQAPGVLGEGSEAQGGGEEEGGRG